MKRKTQPAGTIGYTLEEFDFGDDCLEVELSIAYTLEAYDPGVRYTHNGDGWPPSGGGVDSVTIVAKKASGAVLDYTGEKLAEIQAAVIKRYEADDELKDAIDERCIEDAGERDADDRADYQESRAEIREEHRRTYEHETYSGD